MFQLMIGCFLCIFAYCGIGTLWYLVLLSSIEWHHEEGFCELCGIFWPLSLPLFGSIICIGLMVGIWLKIINVISRGKL